MPDTCPSKEGVETITQFRKPSTFDEKQVSHRKWFDFFTCSKKGHLYLEWALSLNLRFCTCEDGETNLLGMEEDRNTFARGSHWGGPMSWKKCSVHCPNIKGTYMNLLKWSAIIFDHTSCILHNFATGMGICASFTNIHFVMEFGTGCHACSTIAQSLQINDDIGCMPCMENMELHNLKLPLDTFGSNQPSNT